MKTVPACFLLALIAGCGAFWHHVTDDVPHPVRSRVAGGAMPPGDVAGPGIKEITALAREISRKPDTEIRAAYDRQYAGMTGEDFARLASQKPNKEYEGWKPPFLVEYWAAADVAGLLRFAEKNPDKVDPAMALPVCALYDPAAALASLRRLEAANYEVEGLWKKAWDLAAKEKPEAVLAAAEKEGALKDKPGCFTGCVSNWAKRDKDAALAFAKKHPALLMSAVRGWAVQDAEAALAWMKDSGTAQVDTDYYQTLIIEYAQKHPKEAARFRGEVENQKLFDDWIAMAVIRENPLEALQQGYTMEKGDYYDDFAAALSRRPVEEAVACMKLLPEQEWRRAFAEIGAFMSGENPAAAVKFYTQFPDLLAKPTQDSNSSVHEVFERLAMEDPVAASAWMAPGKLPDAVREKALPNVVQAWMLTDRAAALHFVESLPASEAKGLMLLKASGILGDGNEDSARSYAMTLPDLETRIGACREILKSVESKDYREETRAWLDAIPDAAVREALLNPPPPPPPPVVEEMEDPGNPFEDPFATPDAAPEQ